MGNFCAILIAFIMITGVAQAGSRVRLMHYNVENLFDTDHDAGKLDWEFLPARYPGREKACEESNRDPKGRELCLKNDWTTAKLEIKLQQIQRVVEAAGTFPDILSVVEVENNNVVRQLAQKLGYQTMVMTDSPDERGIDVALMFNSNASLKYISHFEHVLSGKELTKPTRNILEVNFRVAGKYDLTVFANHWPSQSAPASVRVAVAKSLMQIIDNKKRSNPNLHVVVTGDFNVISTDRPDPFFDVLANFQQANRLTDVDAYVRQNASKWGAEVAKMPLGTYFFTPDMSWNLLDRFFVSKGLMDQTGLEVDVLSYQIVTPDFAKFDYSYGNYSYLKGSVVKSIPKRYNFGAQEASEAGFSDHFPIVVDFLVK